MKVFDLLFEAQNYEQMFSDLLKAKPDDQRSRDQIARDQVLRDQITENIQWARQNLKKNDRIVWYLRWVKMWLNNMVGLEAYNKRFGTQYTQADLHSIYQIRQNLTHFLGLPIPEIQNYVFKNESPQQIVQVFAQFEQQWRDAMAEEKTLLAPEEDDEILLEFPDGYAWWLLSRGACDAEAEAMGHCGNVPSVKSGDQILSLRRKVQRGNELRWYPVATFIVNDGWLGEMKGRNNDKPIEKYHPYIVALLKHDMIRGIKGGGYMPSHNFSMHDLDPQTREELLAEKPSLASFSDYYHKEGMTPRVQNMLIAAMEEKGLPQFDSYDPQKKQFVVETYRDLDHFLRDIYDSVLEGLISMRENAETSIVDVRNAKLNPDILMDFLSRLPENNFADIATQLRIDPSNPRAKRVVAQTLDHMHGPVYDKIEAAFAAAGDHADLLAEVDERIKEYLAEGWSFECYHVWSEFENDTYDSAIEIRISERDLVDLTDADQEDGDDDDGWQASKVANDGWASVDWENTNERRSQQGLIARPERGYGDYVDQRFPNAGKMEFELEDLVDNAVDQFVSGRMTPTIRDPRQMEIPFESGGKVVESFEQTLVELRRLAGLDKVRKNLWY